MADKFKESGKLSARTARGARRPVVAELSLNRLDYRVSEWRGMSILRNAHRTAAAGLTSLSTQI